MVPGIAMLIADQFTHSDKYLNNYGYYMNY